MLRKLTPLAAAALLLTAGPAFAHVGVGPVDTFSRGFLHPLGGIDHILAMVAVGLFAVNLGGAALWLVPSAFVGTMIFGGALGYYGWPLPMVEAGIGLSVVVMGLAIAFGVRLPTIGAMALVGLFALFHGHAHGTEGIGLGISFLPYAAGFVIATASLHSAGVALGFGLDRLGTTRALMLKRVSGSMGALAGVSLLAGWLVA
ncbi:Protein hupE [Hyphomicrobium sp. GJ21]|uniref:HupE/UreJ family protein n=1 Tax=Hyphomicrobium sp. GJ21 TaxID=113574 RepID=UPI000622C1D9|nr:HupE/UreJ family protein [Hyphomicrobium sp. GJ21]CEJ84388.1 Protein hupE [Hyphomicrobium sp. GJ21]